MCSLGKLQVCVMVRRRRDEIGKVGGAVTAGEVSPRMASSTPPPPPPPCAISKISREGAGDLDMDDEESAVRAFDAALVRRRLFIGGTGCPVTCKCFCKVLAF